MLFGAHFRTLPFEPGFGVQELHFSTLSMLVTYWRTAPDGQRQKMWRLGQAKSHEGFPSVTSFKYLGVMLSYGNFEKATLKHRLQEGNAKLQQVRRFVHNRRTAGPRSRLHIWHSTVWATVSSGLVDVGLTEETAALLRAWHFGPSQHPLETLEIMEMVEATCPAYRRMPNISENGVSSSNEKIVGASSRQRKARFSQRLPVLFGCPSIGLRNICSEGPHAALVWLYHVIAAGIEADGLIVHVQPPAPQLSLSLLVGQPSRGVPLVIFDPHPSSCVVSQSKRMIQVPGHVLNVAVQAHARVEEHGDGRPGALRKAAAEKGIDGCAGLPQARGIARRARKVPPRCFQSADHRSSSGTRFASEGFSVAFRHASSMLYLDPAGTP